VNALAVNDLDKEEIIEEMLNHLATEDLLTSDFGQLSLNALSTVTSPNSIKLRTLVKNKVMLILIDSRSSHSFVSK
jgi:flagellar biosynthesis protein FliR